VNEDNAKRHMVRQFGRQIGGASLRNLVLGRLQGEGAFSSVGNDGAPGVHEREDLSWSSSQK